MIKGWFSASAQQAILRDGRRHFLIMASSAQTRRTTSKEAAVLAVEWPDIYVMKVPSKAAAHEELGRAITCYDALLASSIALDKEIIDDRREQAAIEAERLLQEDGASSYVLNTYLALPMPETADLVGASKICDRHNLQALADIIKTVEIYQQSVRAARKAWEDIAVRRFGRPNEQAIFQATAVRSGVFVSLVKRIGDEKRCLEFLDEVDTPDLRKLPHSHQVLEAWLNNANAYSAAPAGLLPAFSEESEIAADMPPLRAKGKAPMAHAGVSRAIDAFSDF